VCLGPDRESHLRIRDHPEFVSSTCAAPLLATCAINLHVQATRLPVINDCNHGIGMAGVWHLTQHTARHNGAA
jgi:hypothetical protein